MNVNTTAFERQLLRALEERLANSDPSQPLTLGDFCGFVREAFPAEPEPYPAPGYPMRLSMRVQNTNGGSLSELQRGLGPPEITQYRTVFTQAEAEQARREGWA